MPDIDYLRDLCPEHPEMKLGFVVYRFTYQDDAKWTRFMDHLNTRTRLNLEAEGAGDLFPRIDWSLQNNPELDGIDYDEVRKRFNEWLKENINNMKQEPFSMRHLACVAVSQLHVEYVLEGPSSTVFDAFGEGWVAMIPESKKEDYTGVGLSFLVPRVFSLLEIGWHVIDVGVQDVYCN